MVSISRMKMMLAVAALLCLTCGQGAIEPGGPLIDTFPLDIGNRWVYEWHLLGVPFRSEAEPDTLKFTINRRIIGFDDTLLSIGLIVMEDWVFQPGSGEYDSSGTRYWLAIEDDKFKEYAYQTIGSLYGNIHIEEVPAVWLDFPLERDKSWAIYPPNGGVVKRVMGNELMTAADREFVCAKVQTEYSIAPNVLRYEWFSYEGLIAEEIDFGIEYILDEVGHIIDSVHAYEERHLVDIDVD